MRVKSLFIIIILTFSSQIYSQAKSELITDRPDKTESAVIVPFESLQLEIGFMYEKEKFKNGLENSTNENITLAGTLARYGVSDFFELRFYAEYLMNTITSGTTSNNLSGVNAVTIGSKFQLLRNGNIISNAALIGEFALPYGNAFFRPDRIEPSLTLSVDKEISENLNLGINAGVINFSGDEDYKFSSVLGFGLNERSNLFFEYFGFYNKYLPEHFWHLGTTYLLRENLQLDFSLGGKIKGETDYLFGSLGVSVRLPN